MTNTNESVAIGNEIKCTEVPNYKSVQFIGLCISTTPGFLKSIENMSDDGKYLGLDNTKGDIEARIDYLLAQAKKAADSLSKDDDCLKIFVIPEFFFRGVQGAYQTPMEVNLFFRKYFERFVASINEKTYNHWLFVLGTLLTSHDDINPNIEPTKELYPVGDYLLKIYYQLYGGSSAAHDKNRPALHDFLKALDQYQDGAGDRAGVLAEHREFSEILRCTLNYCDSMANILVDNSCFVIAGGTGHPRRILRVLKKHKSKEDFVLNSKYEGKDTGYLQSITKYPQLQNQVEYKENDRDGYAVFEYGGISFGIDICLDHSRKRLLKHLEKTKNYIDIQIIPSCGMSIKKETVIARKGGYVFNCDGEYTLKNSNLANDGVCSHTSLVEVTECIPLPPTTGTAKLSSCMNATRIETTAPTSLFPHKEVFIDIYPILTVKKGS